MYKLVRMEQLIMTGEQNTKRHSLREALAQIEHTAGKESAQETNGVVLSFGSAAKILEPQSVIERIAATCHELLEIYEK